MSLEVDARQKEPIVSHSPQHGEKYSINGDVHRQPFLAPDHGPQSVMSQPRRRSRAPRGLLLLTFSFGVLLVAAIIGLGVSASLAVKRQHQINELVDSMSHICLSPQNDSSTPTTATSSATPTATDGAVCGKPTSDCTNLSMPYSLPHQDDATFKLFCGKDYPGGDMQGVYAYNFEQCMNTCVTQNEISQNEDGGNSPCYGISFDTSMSILQGNCWLKGTKNLTGVEKDVTDSAWLT